MVVDDEGNVYVAWEDFTNYGETDWSNDIFFKRWNANSATWTTVEVVSTESTSAAFSPSLVVDMSGNVHVAWHDTSDFQGSGTDYDIFYKMRNATTNTWTMTEVISTWSPGDSVSPVLALDGTDTVHLVWCDSTEYLGSGLFRDVFYRARDATTRTWSDTELVSTESTLGTMNVVLIAEATGNLHIAWTDVTDYAGAGTDEDVFYKFRNATTGTWMTAEVISTESTNDSFSPCLALDTDGTVHVAWEDYTDYNGAGMDGDVFYKQKNITTGTWTTTVVVSTESTESSWKPSLAVDMKGTVHVAWEDITNQSQSSDCDIFYKLRNATAGTWTTTEMITSWSTGTAKNLQIAVHENTGTVNLVWDDSTDYLGAGTDFDIFYTALACIPDPPSVQRVTPVVSLDGKVTIVWDAIEGSTLYYIYRDLKPITLVNQLTPIAIVDACWFTETILANGTYYYGVMAGNWHYNGTVSAAELAIVSLSISPTVLMPVMPGTNIHGKIFLNWVAVESATSFYVYRQGSPIVSVAGLVPVARVPGTSFIDTVIENGTWYYVIVASSAFGNSTLSNCEHVDVMLVPVNPVLNPIIPSTSTDGKINLYWVGVEGATKYHVYRQGAPIDSVSGLKPIASVSGTWFVDTLTNNGTWYYAIVSDNGLYNSTASNCEQVSVDIHGERATTPGLIPEAVFYTVVGILSATAGIAFVGGMLVNKKVTSRNKRD